MSEKSFVPELPIQFQISISKPSTKQLELRFVAGQDVDRPGMVNKTPGDVFYHSGEETYDHLLISLGDETKITSDSFRIAGAASTKWLGAHHAVDSYLDVDAIPYFDKPENLGALIEGLCLGTYQFTKYKSKNHDQKTITITLLTQKQDLLQKIVDESLVIIQSVFLARNWAHEPANVINPITLTHRIDEVAESLDLYLKIIDDQQLKEMGANAIVAVGQGSETPSRMIILEYPGSDPVYADHPIVLVGKTLTFDSGGYSLKTVESIKNMKYDKCGGIDVVATIVAAARLKLKPRIVGIIGAAENLISGHAYRPDDILSTLSGKTVEIISTDAEGRLVLADCLTYAQKNYSPSALIDLATLTSGIVITLGHVRAGLFSNNQDLASSLMSSGEKTHERLWQLPLDEEYLQFMKGVDADLKNAGGKEGHAILAAIFLKEFIEPSTPWAHLDIAGMADTSCDLPYCPIGATGYGVRLLIDYLRNL